MNDEVAASKSRFRIGDYSVDIGDNTIASKHESLHVEPKAMQVLFVLARNAGETVSREQLMQEIWGGRVVVEDSLTRAVSKLRTALSDTKSKTLIQTVPKKGYRLKTAVIWESVADQTTPIGDASAAQSLERQPRTESTVQSGAHQKEQAKQDALIHSDSVEYKTKHKRNIVTWGLAAFILISAVGAVYFGSFSSLQSTTSKHQSKGAVSIALLPLQNLSGEEQTGYLADGIPEEISGLLAKRANVKVTSQFATYVYAKQGLPLNEIAERLSVRYLLEGSVRKIAQQYRIAMRLVDAKTETVIWSSVYEETNAQLFELQSDVVEAISQQILSPLDKPLSNDVKPERADTVAYQHYLKGLYWLMHGKTSEWFYRAESAFLAAVEQDSKFAAAFGRLAYVYARYDYHDVYMQPQQAIEKSKSAILKATTLDPDEVNAYLAKAVLATKSQDFALAEQSLEYVLNESEDHKTALYLFSELALARNDFDEALKFAEKAIAIDPLSPWINVNLAIVHYWRGSYDSALAALETAISVDENYTWAYVWQSKIYHAKGNVIAAINSMEKCMVLDAASPLNSAWLGKLYEQVGDTEQAQKWFAHTASLYGDVDDARFWQSYMRFKQSHLQLNRDSASFDVIYALLNDLLLLDTPLFSLVPMLEKAAVTTEQKTRLSKVLLISITAGSNEQPFVNIHNLQRARSLLLLDSNTVLDNVTRLSIKQQIEQLEANYPNLLQTNPFD